VSTDAELYPYGRILPWPGVSADDHAMIGYKVGRIVIAKDKKLPANPYPSGSDAAAAWQAGFESGVVAERAKVTREIAMLTLKRSGVDMVVRGFPRRRRHAFKRGGTKVRFID